MLSLCLSLSAHALPDAQTVTHAMNQPPQPTPSQHQAEIARVQDRGAVLAALDARSWLATDRVFELVGLPTPEAPPPFDGWVTRQQGERFQVDFLRDPDRPRLVCTVVFDTPSSQGQASCARRARRVKDPELVASYRARQAAIADPRLIPKVPSYNFEVLRPPSEDGHFEVFILPAMTDFEVIPVLGGYRVDVSAEGTVLSVNELSKDAMSFPTAPEGQQTVAVLTHLLGPTPNEGHTFASARYGITLLVLADGGMWRIEQGVPVWLGEPYSPSVNEPPTGL